MRLKGLIFLVSFLFAATAVAQRPADFKWWYAPQLDSFDQSYADSSMFKIYNAGKVGLYGVNYGQMVPAVYEELGLPVNHNEYYGSNYWLTPVKNKDKWGLYAYVLEDYGIPDTSEKLPCVFDMLKVRTAPEEYDILVDVRLGKKTGVYNVRYGTWEVPLSEQHPKPKGPPTMKYVVPRIQEVPEPPPMLEDRIYEGEKTTIGTMTDDAKDYMPVYAKVQSSDYERRDTNALRLHRMAGDKGQLSIVVRRGYRRKFGVLRSKTKEVLITPDYANIEYSGDFFLCTKYEDGNFVQVFDTLGKPVTPRIQWRNGINRYTHRLAFNEQKQYAVYDMQWKLLQPFVYDQGQFSRQERYIKLRKNGKWFLYDMNSSRMLGDSFDVIHSDVEFLYFLATDKQKLFLYNTGNNTKSLVKKAQFVRFHDSFGIIQKKGKQAVLNLSSGKLNAFMYDSILFIPDFADYRRWHKKPQSCNTSRVLLTYNKGRVGLADAHGNEVVANLFDRVSYPNPRLIILSAGKYSTYYSLCKSAVVMDSVEFSDYFDYRIPPNYVNEDYNRSRIKNYLVIFKRNGLMGVMMEPDSLVLPAIFDTVMMVENHTIFRNKKGYYVLNTNRLPFSESEYCDSFRVLNYGDLELHKGAIKSLVNRNGDLEVAAVDSDLQTLHIMGGNVLYSYSYQGKFGLVQTQGFNTGAVFEAVRFGANRLVWAKYEGKWGIVEY